MFVLEGDFKLFIDNKNWRFVNRSRPSLLKTIYDSLFVDNKNWRFVYRSRPSLLKTIYDSLFIDNKNWRFVNRSRPSLLKTIYDSLFKYINENRVIRITLVIENMGKPIFT